LVHPLPFDAFLELLRAKGYGVGLHEFAAAASLLRHWDRTKVDELGDALAALVARSDDEVRGIRRLFDEIYAPPPRVVAMPSVAPPRPPLAWLREHTWAVAIAAAVILLLIVGTRRTPPRAVPPAAPASVVPPVSPPRAAGDAVSLPPPPAPDLPPAPRRTERRLAAGLASGMFLLALSAFWFLKIRDDRRVWMRQAWDALRSTLPGPFHYYEAVRERPNRLPKTDVEDAATLLGRVFSKSGLARELDIARTLRETLRRGLLPTLVTKPRRVAETILVVHDLSQEMRIWDAKVHAFLADLRRQGIALNIHYCDSDFSRVSDRPHRPAMALDTLLRARPDAPLLVISSGAGISASLEARDREWMPLLRARLRKAWLTPVADPRLWPKAFAALPIDVWPMTRAGLANAARQLAGIEADTTPVARERMMRDGFVPRADIEQLKRLASLVPNPSPALLESLRQEFAPEVSDAALLHVMNEGDGPASSIVRMTDDEVRRCLAAIRRETPDLEIAARRMVLGVLADSQPVAGSAAHERWQIAVEMQHLELADVEGAADRATRAVERLQELAAGPMGAEVQEAIRLAPASPGLKARVERLASHSRASLALPEQQRRLADVRPLGWSWPGLRELVPASIVAAVLLGAAIGLHALPARAVEHLTEVYRLDYAPIPSVATPRLTLVIGAGAANVPRTVSLYRENVEFRTGLQLGAAGSTTVALQPENTGAHFQVRAALPQGNLAVSPWVWVTSDKLAFVLVDAAPWANVTIVGGNTRTPVQQTPFTAALMPGTYQVHFENPALGPASTLDRTISVPQENTVRVTMLGFDAARAVDSLLQPPSGATAR
jgi:hypothetical protein